MRLFVSKSRKLYEAEKKEHEELKLKHATLSSELEQVKTENEGFKA